MNRDLVSIKGTRQGLVILLDPTSEFEEIKNTLLRKMESAKGFFKGARFSLLGGQQEIPPHQKNELEDICIKYGLVPNSEEQAFPIKEAASQPQKKAVPAPSFDGEEALLVRRSLRSGQKVVHSGHIVVLGDVHAGAEIISGGNVLVMGSCRGVIHAGAQGNLSARVIARRLAPTVLSIAGRRCPPEISDVSAIGSAIAHFNGQDIVFEKYQAVR